MRQQILLHAKCWRRNTAICLGEHEQPEKSSCSWHLPHWYALQTLLLGGCVVHSWHSLPILASCAYTFYDVHVCIAGTLPAEYSKMSLTRINLYSNKLTGDLLQALRTSMKLLEVCLA